MPGDLTLLNVPRPPVDGFRSGDLDVIAGLPPHNELVDGALILVAPQRKFRSLTQDLLVQGLRRQAPVRWRVWREMSVVLGLRLWRVEDSGEGRIVVYVYELDPAARVYAVTGIYHDRLKLTVPFEIDIDLTEIDQL
jgi:hypothetical protein